MPDLCQGYSEQMRHMVCTDTSVHTVDCTVMYSISVDQVLRSFPSPSPVLSFV